MKVEKCNIKEVEKGSVEYDKVNTQYFGLSIFLDNKKSICYERVNQKISIFP